MALLSVSDNCNVPVYSQRVLEVISKISLYFDSLLRDDGKRNYKIFKIGKQNCFLVFVSNNIYKIYVCRIN